MKGLMTLEQIHNGDWGWRIEPFGRGWQIESTRIYVSKQNAKLGGLAVARNLGFSRLVYVASRVARRVE